VWRIVSRRRVVRESPANRWANLPVLFLARYSLLNLGWSDLRLGVSVTLPVEYAVSVPVGETPIAGWACTAHWTGTMNVEHSLSGWLGRATRLVTLETGIRDLAEDTVVGGVECDGGEKEGELCDALG